MARVGIDLDGVCYDFAASLRQYVHQSYGTPGPDRAVNATDCTNCMKGHPDPWRWEFYLDWEWSEATFKRWVRDGVDEGVVFLWGPALPGTKDAFVNLDDAGHEVVVVTDRVGLGGPNARKNTEMWLLKEGLSYHELHYQADKTLVDLDYHLDDKLENYDALDAAGVKVYLWDRPWNQDDDKERRRVSSWDEFLEQVEGIEYLTTGAGSPDFPKLTELLREQSPFQDEVRVTSLTGGQKGQKLARLGSLDPLALLEVAKVAGFGEQKYDRLNYMKGYDWSLSFDAGQRHRLTFWSGEEDFDPESGICHLAHSVWQDLTLLAFFLRKRGNDDRWKDQEDVA